MVVHPKSSRVSAGGTIPSAFSFYRPVDEQIVNATKQPDPLNRCDEVFGHRDQIMTSNNAIPV